MYGLSLHWRHNDRDGVSNHQRLDSLLNPLSGRRSKKTSKPRVTGFLVTPSCPNEAAMQKLVCNNQIFHYKAILIDTEQNFLQSRYFFIIHNYIITDQSVLSFSATPEDCVCSRDTNPVYIHQLFSISLPKWIKQRKVWFKYYCQDNEDWQYTEIMHIS